MECKVNVLLSRPTPGNSHSQDIKKAHNGAFLSPSRLTAERFNYLLTASLSALPALNPGVFEAAIWMVSPVRGLRP